LLAITRADGTTICPREVLDFAIGANVRRFSTNHYCLDESVWAKPILARICRPPAKGRETDGRVPIQLAHF
jgi:hypothetical protein